jgi:kynurenine formamidase
VTEGSVRVDEAKQEQLHAFTDDTDTYVAASIEDAMSIQREHMGMREEDQDPEAWEQIPDERVISIHTDDNGQAAEADSPLIAKTAAEWVAHLGARGFLCSTEY